MARAFFIILVISASAILLFSCGEIAGNDPIGITGGGESGYGIWSMTSSDLVQQGDESGYTGDIAGYWRRDFDVYHYMIWTFSPDGIMSAAEYQGSNYSSNEGLYKISDDQLILVKAGDETVFTFSIRDNTLLLTGGGESISFYRVK